MKPIEIGSLRKILVRLPNWVGDVVMIAPSVGALARAAPDAEIVATARPALEPLAAALPGVSKTIALPRARGLGGIRAEAAALRREGFQASVVFPRSTRAVVPVALARVPIRVGFASDGRSAWLTHPVAGWRRRRLDHRSSYYGSLLAPFGIEPGEPWRWTPAAEALRWADDFLREAPGRRPGTPVVAFEAAAAYGPAKRWPVEGFAEVARRLRGDGVADVVVLGTEDTRSVEEGIATLAGVPVLRASGRTDLLRLAGLLARSASVLTNDTGPMHLAAAVGTPVVALFGATDPQISGPRGGPATVLYEKVPCSPCFLRECPVPGHPCLTRLSVDRVHGAVLDSLARGSTAGTFAGPTPRGRTP